MSTSRQRVSAALKRFQPKPKVQIGTLGNVAGVVDVPGKSNYVYVTIPGSGTLVVYNKRIAPVPGMPVEIGRDPLEPDLYQVIDIHKYPSVSTTPLAPGGQPAPHAPTHNWAGTDPVYIEKRQLMPLRATAIGGMNVFVTRETAYYDGDWQFISGTNLDMSGYVPATGSLYALIYKDVDEVIKVNVTGSTLKDALTLTLQDAPQPYSGTVPIALVQLYGGQSGIFDGASATDIVDIRQLWSPVLLTGTSSGGITTGTSGGHIIQDEGSSLPARSKLNFVGAGVIVSDDAGNDRTNVLITGSGSSSGLGDYIYIASQHGAILDTNLTSGGGTDDTAALQAILNRASSNNRIVLILDGPALISGLDIYSNTSLICQPGAGLYLKDGSNRGILRNAHRTRSTPQDAYISIQGGYYNGNRANQSGTGIWPFQEADNTFMSGMQFFGVSHLQIHDTVVENQMAFGYNIANATDVDLENISSNCGAAITTNGSDGLHLNGPITHLQCRNIRVHSWDDAIAINAGDDSALDLTTGTNSNSHGPYIGQGLISDVLIDGVYLDNCLSGVRLLSHNGNSRIDRVDIRNVQGSVHNQDVILSTFAVGTGSFGGITLENWDVDEVSQAAQGDTDYCWMKVADAIAIEELTLRNISVHSPIDTRPLIWVQTTALIHNLDVDGLSIYDNLAGAVGMVPMKFDGTVYRLTAKNLDWYRVSGLSRGSNFIDASNASSFVGTARFNGIVANNITHIVNHTNGTFANIDAVHVRSEDDGGNATFYSSGTISYVTVSNWIAGGVVWSGTATATAGDAFGTGSGTGTSVTGQIIRQVLYDNTLSGNGTWDVSGISGSYDHLEIVAKLRGSAVATYIDLIVTENNDTTDANYYSKSFYQNATASGVFGSANRDIGGIVSAASSTASYFTAFKGEIQFYASDQPKIMTYTSTHRRDTAAETYIINGSLIYITAAAISRIALAPSSGSFVAGSRLQIIGVKTG